MKKFMATLVATVLLVLAPGGAALADQHQWATLTGQQQQQAEAARHAIVQEGTICAPLSIVWYTIAVQDFLTAGLIEARKDLLRAQYPLCSNDISHTIQARIPSGNKVTFELVVARSTPTFSFQSFAEALGYAPTQTAAAPEWTRIAFCHLSGEDLRYELIGNSLPSAFDTWACTA